MWTIFEQGKKKNCIYKITSSYIILTKDSTIDANAIRQLRDQDTSTQFEIEVYNLSTSNPDCKTYLSSNNASARITEANFTNHCSTSTYTKDYMFDANTTNLLTTLKTLSLDKTYFKQQGANTLKAHRAKPDYYYGKSNNDNGYTSYTPVEESALNITLKAALATTTDVNVLKRYVECVSDTSCYDVPLGFDTTTHNVSNIESIFTNNGWTEKSSNCPVHGNYVSKCYVPTPSPPPPTQPPTSTSYTLVKIEKS